MGDRVEIRSSRVAGTAGYGKEEMMDSKDGFVESETSNQDDDSGWKPHVGMEFDSEDAARTFYDAYARRIGFSIHIGQYSHSRPGGPIVGREFACSREVSKRKSVEGCKAMLKIERKNSGTWVVTKFVDEHNHSTTPSKVHNLRPRKDVSVVAKNVIKKSDTSDHVHISGDGNHTSYEPTHGSKNGAHLEANQKCRCTWWTYYVRPCSTRRTLGKDAHHLLDYFKKMQAESPGFFYSIQLDDENRLTNVFWADARSRAAYKHFGDAVTFDTMYRISMYQVPFAPFTGVNHHGQMVLFGCALILDESEASFIWLFKTWLSAMNSKHPASITTDQDKAIQAAISQVLPQTRHCICKWHILREGQERLAHVYLAHPLFYTELYSCINYSETIEDFESAWCSLLDKYSLRNNEWLEAVYNARRQWAPVFFRDTFFGSVFSSQGVKTFFDGYVNQQTKLPVFFKQYERAFEDSLEREIAADFESIHINPVLKTPSPMEQQAADQYTRKIFAKFQEELVETFAYTANKIGGDEIVSKFRVAKYEDDHKVYVVTVNVSDLKANCSCRMFEYAGVLCRHILTVFTVTNVLTVPSHYILKRWTKTAKSSIQLHEHNQSADLLGVEALTLRFTHLCQEAIRFAEEGSVALETYNAAIAALREGTEKLAIIKNTVAKAPPLGSGGTSTMQEKSAQKNSFTMSELIQPSRWPLQGAQPHHFNLNDAGATVADLNHASMISLSGLYDGSPLDNMGTVTCFKSMTWVIESNNCATPSAKVAVINLKLQKYGRSTPENTEVLLRLKKATLEPMLRSIASVSQQLSLLPSRTAVINLKVQDTKATSGETELKFQVSGDNLSSMLRSMTSLHQQL